MFWNPANDNRSQEKGNYDLVVPKENIREASLVKGINIFGFEKLTEVISFLEGVSTYTTLEDLKCDHVIQRPYLFDFQDVQGQDAIIEFIVATAAGGHNLIMSGAPGCGKSMIAKRLPSILPSMTEKEALEVTKIYSVSGVLKNKGTLITERPFRAQHHNASMNSLAGGGNNAMPGEISLAHNGVLFLVTNKQISLRYIHMLERGRVSSKLDQGLARVPGGCEQLVNNISES